MKKLNLDFGGGRDDIILSIPEKKFFSYEMDRDMIHEQYGGKACYTSRTGQSGSGWIEKQDDLILFGHYRTDCDFEQIGKSVHSIPEKEWGQRRSIFGYVPITSHGGIDYSSPVILTDGKIVVFSNPEPAEVIEWLLQWDKWEGKIYEKYQGLQCHEVDEDIYDANGNHETLKWFLLNFNHYKRIRATRFIDLRDYQQEVENKNLLNSKMAIYERSGIWLHMNKERYFDKKFETNPRDIIGEIVDGWKGLGNEIFYRRLWDQIEAFIEVKRSSYANGKWHIEGETPEWLDYEKIFSVIEFFSKTEEEVKGDILESVRKKAQEDYLYARKRTGIDETMLEESDERKEVEKETA